jgi:hypothetical protein
MIIFARQSDVESNNWKVKSLVTSRRHPRSLGHLAHIPFCCVSVKQFWFSAVFFKILLAWATSYDQSVMR